MSPPLPRPKPIQSNHFGPIRILLAAMVVASVAITAANGTDPLTAATLGQLSLAEAGVCGLTAVAGFLAADSFVRRGAWAFLARRALAVWPLVLAANLLVGLVAGPMLGARVSAATAWEIAWRSAAVQPVTLQLPGTGAEPAVNAPMIVVGYLARCYLILATVSMAGRRWPWAAGAIFLAAWAGFIGVALGGWRPHLPAAVEPFLMPAEGWPVMLTFFFSGALLRGLHGTFRLRRAPLAVALAAVIGLAQVPGAMAVLLPTAGVYALYHFAFIRAGGTRYAGRAAFGMTALAGPAAAVAAAQGAGVGVVLMVTVGVTVVLGVALEVVIKWVKARVARTFH